MGLRFRFGAILPIASAIASPSRVDRSAVWAMRCLLWLAAGFASFVPRAAGQEIRAEQGEIMVEPGVASPAAVNPFAAVLHASEEAGTLLRRAEEGIERQDWKLAIDSLQRMIELPGEHILARDGHVYESAGRVAQRRIAALPEPGLRAYRLVHDKEAAALLEQAVAQYDADLLRAVVDRFLLTGVGDEAAVTLADWLIDDGRLAEAASILKWLQVVYPDSDLPGWLVDARMAICLGYSGEMEQARSRLDRAAASTPVGGQPGRVEDRLGEIGRWLSSARTATGQAMAGPITGHLFADRKPPAQIDFPPELDWRVDLPLEWPADGLPTFQRHARELGLLPAAGLATDGRVVLVKSGLALLAIDVETFQPRWQAKAAALGADEQTRRSGAGLIIAPERSNSGDWAADPLFVSMFMDGVGSQVAMAAGLALTIEWPAGPPAPVALWTLDGRPVQRGLQYDSAAASPNRLAAYDLASGRLVWASDTAGDEGLLAGVQFLSVPAFTGEYLFGICRVVDDLYAVLLEPATGRLVKHLYLCGTGGGPFNALYPRIPCLADGLAYLPTGRGVLLAVDLAECSVRWASRYDHLAIKTAGDSWLPLPPLAFADSVILAPEDADQLICFDRTTGRIRWQVPRGDMRYVIAATGDRVWLAGDRVCSLEVATGEELWAAPAGRPLGRGMLAGNMLYLPTENGLVALEADTGRRVDVAQPPDGDWLGNLAVVADATFSLLAGQVRKFPDLQNAYPDALARHRENPADGDTAIRLAWLESLRQRPSEALEALSHVPPQYETDDPHRYNHLVHLRVKTMLELAGSEQTAVDEASRLLEQAQAIARTPQDGIASALALGEHYLRQDRVLDACRQYLTLTLSEEGDEPLPEEPGFERQARIPASQRLAAAAQLLPAPDADRLAEHIRERLADAIEQRDERLLARLAQTTACGQAGDEAALILGAWAAHGSRFEQAESMFSRVLRGRGDVTLRAEAAARLAMTCLQPGELHQPLPAISLIVRLEGELAAGDLPREILTEGETGRVSAGQAAEQLRRLIDPALLAQHQAAMEPVKLPTHLSQVTLWAYPDCRPIVPRAERQPPFVDRYLMLGGDNQIEARAADDGRLLWTTQLILLGELAVQSEVDRELQTPVARIRRGPTVAARGAVAGQTFILNSSQGLHAVGLVTGRRLWSRRFEPPALAHQEVAGSDAWLWAEGGYVATVDRRGRLEVAPADAGQSILWRRSNPQRQWYWVRIRGSTVVAIDPDLERVDLFQLEDGTHRGFCRFRQLPDKVSLTLFDEVICGPVAGNEVAAFDLATPGIERWRVAMPADLCQIFKPAPDRLALSDRAGRLMIVDPQTGRVLHETRLNACAEGVTDGVVRDGILYACGFQVRPWGQPDEAGPTSGTGRGPDFARQRWGLGAVRLSDNAVLWQIADIGPRPFLNADVLRAVDGLVPVVVYRPRGTAPRTGIQVGGVDAPLRGAGTLELTLYDRVDGQQVTDTAIVELPEDPAAGLVADVRVWPQAIDVVIGAVTVRFPLTGTAR